MVGSGWGRKSESRYPEEKVSQEPGKCVQGTRGGFGKVVTLREEVHDRGRTTRDWLHQDKEDKPVVTTEGDDGTFRGSVKVGTQDYSYLVDRTGGPRW